MEYFSAKAGSEVVIVRTDAGEDVLESLEKAVKDKGLWSGLIASGAGALSAAVLAAAKDYGPPPADELVRVGAPAELVALSGIIAGGVLDARAVVAGPGGLAAGRLESGTVAAGPVEVVLLKLEGVRLGRETDPETGFQRVVKMA